ncbi:SET domain-containing protein [Flavobacterium johnsoniae]|uniref:SET domain-containing protein n=1 Tax=Flavobacterium johnsoniae TaxID=986 RepID=UPI0011EED937|nr:SET domain-containing protein [Flavobacterium johnsoniae]
MITNYSNKSFIINKNDPYNNKICSIRNIDKNEVIGVWVIDKPISKRSRCLFQSHMSKKWWETDDLGRFCNHSFYPNTILINYTGKLILKARQQIQNGEEISVDYTEITKFIGYIPNTEFNI